MTVRTPPAPPEGLSDGAQQLWSALVARRCRSAGRLALLEQALRARDMADELGRLLGEQALVTITKTTSVIHVNPLLKAQREARQQFVKIMALLHLQWDPQLDGNVMMGGTS